MGLLLRSAAGGVVTLTLDRPAQYNALSDELLGELLRALETISADAAARVVVLAGAGKAFCAGHDLKELSAANPAAHRATFERCGRVMLALGALPQPVIARVHGVATAAGCQLVAACDLAVAAEGARFGVSGINVGLFCSTPSVALGRNVGRKQAFEMLVTGELIDARAALGQGLVNRVVPAEALDAEVGRLCAAIVAKSAVAVRTGKQVFYRQLELGLIDAYALATEAMLENLAAEDAKEGIDAFIARRPPTYQGR